MPLPGMPPSAPAVLLMVPPEPAVPVPVTVKDEEPIKFWRTMPFAPPLALTEVNVIVPVAPLILMAVPVVVATFLAVTLMPAMLVPLMALAPPVLMSIPFTVTFVASVRVLLSVGVFAAAPGTVSTPPTLSVAPAPMRLWPDSIVYAPVVGPEPFAT